MYEGRSEVGQAHCCIGKIDLHSKVRRLTGSFTADDSLDLDQTKAWKWYVQQNVHLNSSSLLRNDWVKGSRDWQHVTLSNIVTRYHIHKLEQ